MKVDTLSKKPTPPLLTPVGFESIGHKPNLETEGASEISSTGSP